MISIFFTYYYSPIENRRFSSLMELMPDYIKYKIIKYRKWEDAHGCLLGKCLLIRAFEFRNEILLLTDLQYNEFGRPYFATYRNLDFNISHSGNIVVCVITNKGKIGVDIEKKNNINIFDFKEQFSSREWEYIKDEKFPYNIFYDCWTKKEAVLKADGRGLISTLDRIDTMQLEGITIDNQYWFFRKINIFKDYACHLAYNIRQDNIHLHYVDFKTNSIR